MRPYRSVLYVPAPNARAIDKARSLACDAIIFDLEDSVLPEEKAAARATLVRVLADCDFGDKACIVRINSLGTPWGQQDAVALGAAMAHGVKADAILIPKVGGPADLDPVAALLPGADLWAMMETPLAMLNAAAIAAVPVLRGMVMGTNDLAKDLGSRARPDRLPLQAGLGLCLLAARAHGRVIIDGVFNDIRDQAGFAAECAQGRDLGFDGKTLIHPGQIATANRAFAPTEEEIELARRQIAAFEAAMAMGKAIAVVDGKIVENLHIVMARATLGMAARVGSMV